MLFVVHEVAEDFFMPFIVVINFPNDICPMRIGGSTQSKVLSMWVIIHWTDLVCIVPRAVGVG